MTNEEIIRHTRYLANKHKDDTVLTFETNFHLAFTDIANHIEEQVKENDKLKAEIEQLKSELEQSVKLPCKCEDCKYADFMSASAERFYCMEHRRYMNVGGYCSFGKAEQSLKGGAD